MLDIQVIGSSSKGNCYLLDDGHTKIMLECGVKISDVRKACNFELSKVAGCLISHEHGDHIKFLNDTLKSGIDCYMSNGTADAIGKEHHRIKRLEVKKTFKLGSWTILPFDVQHDGSEPFGYLLSNGKEKLLFVTDTYYVKYRFQGLTHIMVECNYSLPIVDANIELGRIHPSMKKRLLKSHFSLENVKEFFKANDLAAVEEIYLLHLSDTNSDEALFKKEIEALTGIPVTVC